MKYIYHDADAPLKEMLCRVNDISLEDLDVKDFRVDDPLVLKEFREKLLSLRDKRFFIVGDYDCDGICSTAIMKKLFDDLQISANYYIPSRSKEGYGINRGIVENASKYGFDVILCVDNGIIANEQLEYARELGLMTLVIDHHEYQEAPHCDAFLHPDIFPPKYADMCASGLCALLSASIREDELTAVYGGLATLADMVSVFGYNRYLLTKMLEILKNRTVYPISYLLKNKNIDYETLSFEVIPKINAVSRMDDALNVNYVVRYLLEDSSSCMNYLEKIEGINTTRKELTKEMTVLARRLIDDRDDVIVVSSSAFREGLCGLIANRLMYEKMKPVIVLSESDGICKGSGRAPKGSDFHHYLEGAQDLFDTFGGHAQAVGLSLKKERYEKLLSYIREHPFTFEEPSRDVYCYAKKDINNTLLEEIEELKPFGTGFEEPLLGIVDPTYTKSFLIASSYPKYVLNEMLEAISFEPSFYRRSFDRMIGHLKKDTYHIGKLSFVIEDLVEF